MVANCSAPVSSISRLLAQHSRYVGAAVHVHNGTSIPIAHTCCVLLVLSSYLLLCAACVI